MAEIPFRELVDLDEQLRGLREQYVNAPPAKRRSAAQWAHDNAHASMLMARATGTAAMVHPAWHDAAASLAIDPGFAPAILTVGSIEYQYGRVEEAMRLFLQLTTLPADTECLAEIIDAAGDFLIDQDDAEHAGQLYAAAARAYPNVALYYVGLGYCLAEAGQFEESVEQHRRAVALEPKNHLHLNDFGYSLLQAGRLDEAEEVLQRAVEIAPPNYAQAKANLDHLRKIRSEPR
ncbi:MAG: hypothetical protein KJ000_30200 [Pirellulaceae bacterium]|nr:hypothetical protein [Pirellulaceae bacterium]